MRASVNATPLYTPRVAKLGSARFCRTPGLTTVRVCAKESACACVCVCLSQNTNVRVHITVGEINELTVRAVGESDPLGR